MQYRSKSCKDRKRNSYNKINYYIKRSYHKSKNRIWSTATNMKWQYKVSFFINLEI